MQWQFLVSPWQENERISRCWMQNVSLPPCNPGKSTERAFDLQHHGRCTHNRHHQHVRHHCAPAATKQTNKQHHEQWHCVQAHKYEQINNQHERQHYFGPTRAPPCWPLTQKYGQGKLRHSDMKSSTELQARGTWKYSTYTQQCQHLQHCFSDELTYSFLTSYWCQLWIKKLHHRIA